MLGAAENGEEAASALWSLTVAGRYDQEAFEKLWGVAGREQVSPESKMQVRRANIKRYLYIISYSLFSDATGAGRC